MNRYERFLRSNAPPARSGQHMQLKDVRPGETFNFTSRRDNAQFELALDLPAMHGCLSVRWVHVPDDVSNVVRSGTHGSAENYAEVVIL